MPKPADPRWMERLVQTRYQSKQDYFAWCDNMATSFMEFAKLFEERGEDEAALKSQWIAKTFKEEMEKIIHHG